MAVQSSELEHLVSEENRETLGWITKEAAQTHSAHPIGVFDGVMVFEFIPKMGSVE